PRALLGSQDLQRARLARHVEQTVDVISCRHQHGEGDASKLLWGPRTRHGNLREGLIHGRERQQSAARLKPEIILVWPKYPNALLHHRLTTRHELRRLLNFIT